MRALADGGEASAGEELALRVAGAALRLAHSGSDFQVNTRDERRMIEAVRVIEERLTEKLSIATLAEEVGMSRYHFLRTFQRTRRNALSLHSQPTSDLRRKASLKHIRERPRRRACLWLRRSLRVRSSFPG